MNRIYNAALTSVSLSLLAPLSLFSASLSPGEPRPAIAELSLSAPGGLARADVPLPSGPAEERLSGESLFLALHDKVSDTGTPVSSYMKAKAYMFAEVDNIGCGSGPGILTFYSQVCVPGSSSSGNNYHERGDQNGDGTVDRIINAEHIWPRSFSDGALPMSSDLHQLASTFETPNGRRSNLRFALVSDPVYSTDSGSKLGREGFEPADAVKGNVARAVLYFVLRYYDRSIRNGMNYRDFWVERVPMFLEWNRMDPPDAAERRRNGLVESFQGNRNPFIDDPSLADRIGAAVFRSH